MPGQNLSLSKSNLAYAKLTATPTAIAWSQAYNAGNLFACLSLTLPEGEEKQGSLQTLGKELFNNLEAEFFTLTDKNLETIKDAIQKSVKHIAKDVTVNFCLAFFKTNILYLFIVGRGRIIMKRGDKLGLLLEQKDITEEMIKTASGLLQNNDTIILETSQFAKNVSEQQISAALQLDLPNDIADTLSVHMHEKMDGDQAAIIVTYHGASTPAYLIDKEINEPEAEDLEDEELLAQEQNFPQEKKSAPPSFSALTNLFTKIKLPFRSEKRHIDLRLNHRKKIFLSITIIILALLVVSIYLTKQKQEADKITATFQAIYPAASKNYDEGASLKSLNPDLSREDFLKAEKIIKENQNKLPKNSKEANQIASLLSKIENELGPSIDTADTIPVKETTPSDNSLLAVAKTAKENLGVSQDEDNIYYITPEAVTAVSKSNGKKKELIKNNKDWQQAVAVVPYQGNLYVLDQKDGILKFVKSADEYTKSPYLKTSPDLSKAVAMAIDSSIWLLFSDGSIKKYTRGTEDSFSTKGLEKPLNAPLKIYTDKDINNVYILDRGNSRIVKIANDGSFKAQYKAGVLRTAKDFEVSEKDKKILILSNDKIWELSL